MLYQYLTNQGAVGFWMVKVYGWGCAKVSVASLSVLMTLFTMLPLNHQTPDVSVCLSPQIDSAVGTVVIKGHPVTQGSKLADT